METSEGIIESLLKKTVAYAKTTYEISRLKSLETGTRVVTSLISRLIVIVIIIFFAFILNIGIALWLGELLGKPYYGFFIVAAFYLVAGIVLHFFLHRWIKKPLTDLLITQAFQ